MSERILLTGQPRIRSPTTVPLHRPPLSLQPDDARRREHTRRVDTLRHRLSACGRADLEIMCKALGVDIADQDDAGLRQALLTLCQMSTQPI